MDGGEEKKNKSIRNKAGGLRRGSIKRPAFKKKSNQIPIHKRNAVKIDNALWWWWSSSCPLYRWNSLTFANERVIQQRSFSVGPKKIQSNLDAGIESGGTSGLSQGLVCVPSWYFLMGFQENEYLIVVAFNIYVYSSSKNNHVLCLRIFDCTFFRRSGLNLALWKELYHLHHIRLLCFGFLVWWLFDIKVLSLLLLSSNSLGWRNYCHDEGDSVSYLISRAR